MATLKNTTIDDTGFITIPSGTITQRPSPAANGMIRYNTDLGVTEYYASNNWLDITTGKPPIVTSGLVLHLDAGDGLSYPGSGNTWFDISGNGNTGTLTNGPTYNSGNSGSIAFDGTNDYVNFSIINPFAETVMVWAKSSTSTWNTYGWISSSRRQNGHFIHPWVSSNNVSFSVFDGTLGSYNGTSVSIGSVSPANITIPHLYCFTTNGSNSHKIYLDGAFITENTSTISRSGSPTAQTYTVGRDDGFERYGSGNIYMVLRYNRVLTATEIQQNFQALRGRYGI